MSNTPIKPKTRTIINPVTGQLEQVRDNNFSYENIPVNKRLVIHENNQMVVYDGFEVDGELDLYGSLILEE